jgi:hypothetical protein
MNQTEKSSDDQGVKLTAQLSLGRESWLKYEVALLAVLTVIGILVTNQLVRQADVKSVPPPVKVIPNFIAATTLDVANTSADLPSSKQDTAAFISDDWVTKTQLFIANTKADAFLELKLPPTKSGKSKLSLYLTRAGDYGKIQVSVNGKLVGEPIDLFDRQVGPYGPLDLGEVDLPVNPPTPSVIRFTVVGRNPDNTAPFYQFGIQGLTLN